jgi:DnaJ-class molecular chaperone
MAARLTCPYCIGKGKDYFELLAPDSFCPVCKGEGVVYIEEPYRQCVFCKGTGKNPLGARITCIVCGGKGYNSKTGDETCNKCNGTGRASDGLPCTRCKGKGFIERSNL